MDVALKMATCVARVSVPVPAQVLTWLQKVAADTLATFMSRKNNLKWWCILNITIMSLALADTKLRAQASAAWDDAIESLVQDDGTMPAELARGAKSANYHEYATNPMVTAAFWLQKDHPRIHAAVDYVLSQDRTSLPKILHWIGIYHTKYHGFAKLKHREEALAEWNAIQSNPLYACNMGGSVLWQIGNAS